MTHVVPVIEPCAHLPEGLRHSVAAGVDVRVSLHQSQRMHAVPGTPTRPRRSPSPRSAAADRRSLGKPSGSRCYGHFVASAWRQVCCSAVSGSEYSICSISVEVPTVICVTSELPGWISSVENRIDRPPAPTATAGDGSGGGEITLRWTVRA